MRQISTWMVFAYVQGFCCTYLNIFFQHQSLEYMCKLIFEKPLLDFFKRMTFVYTSETQPDRELWHCLIWTVREAWLMCLYLNNRTNLFVSYCGCWLLLIKKLYARVLLLLHTSRGAIILYINRIHTLCCILFCTWVTKFRQNEVENCGYSVYRQVAMVQG